MPLDLQPLAPVIARAAEAANDWLLDRRLRRAQAGVGEAERRAEAFAKSQVFARVDVWGPSAMRDRRALASRLRPHVFKYPRREAMVAAIETRDDVQAWLLAVGDEDSVSCDLRRLVRLVDRLDATALVLAHNHFHAVTPSAADVQMIEALRPLARRGLNVDAMIIGKRSAWSFATGRVYPRSR